MIQLNHAAIADNTADTHQAAKPKAFYRPELDLLRLFAFLCVFLVHMPPMGYIPHEWAIKHVGSFGVCLFFFLSSYLITELLIRENEREHTIHLKAFYLRRILRIWPLYFGFLFLGWIFGLLFPSFRLLHGQLLAFIFLAGNIYTAAFGWTSSPIFPLWSISNEEQFYLCIPVLAKYAGKRGILIASIALLPVSYLTLVVLALRQTDVDHGIWANSLVQFQFFAAGGLAAILLKGRAPKAGGFARVLVIISGLVLWFVANILSKIKGEVEVSRPWFLCGGYVLLLIGTALIFLAFLGMKTSWAPRWMIYLGKVSYGLYVFHVFALLLVSPKMATGRFLHLSPPAQAVAGLLLTIGLAKLSYDHFEKRFILLKQKFSFVESRGA